MREWIRAVFAFFLRSLVFPGRERLTRIFENVFGEVPLPQEVPLYGGGKLILKSRNWRTLYYMGCTEYDTISYIRKNIKPGQIIFDIGGSIGICAIPFARMVGPSGHVYAFEANPPNFELLCQNIKLNNLSNVTSVNCAVAEKAGFIEIPKRLESSNYSLASASPDGTIRMQALRLDDFAEEHGIDRIDFMKIDIEGSETNALKGAAKLFRSGTVRKMLLEFNPFWLKKMGSSAAELYDLFESYGLQVSFLTKFGGVKPITREECMALLIEDQTYFNLILENSVPYVSRRAVESAASGT
jgi:FkbM family methyltransferase